MGGTAREGRGTDDPSGGAAGDSARRIAGASSARRVLHLLLSFSERRPRASVAELSSSLGVPAGTTYRYVALLKELGLLEEGAANQYHLTSTVMPAAQMVNDHARLARPSMVDASRELRERVMLFQVSGDTVVCVGRVECDRPEPRPQLRCHSRRRGSASKSCGESTPATRLSAHRAGVTVRNRST